MRLEIQTLAWDRHKNVAKLKLTYWIIPTLDNWISYDYAGINKQYKT